MTQRPDCLICGRPLLPSGDPSCGCLTHTLFRPVNPPEHGPDPADVARFPLEPRQVPAPRHGPDAFPTAPADPPARPVPWAPTSMGGGPTPAGSSRSSGSSGPHGAHRKPRRRLGMAAAAGGAMAAVVGCTALAASLTGGQWRPQDGPTQAATDGGQQSLPDGEATRDRPDSTATGGSAGPAPEDPSPTASRSGASGPATGQPGGPGGSLSSRPAGPPSSPDSDASTDPQASPTGTDAQSPPSADPTGPQPTSRPPSSPDQQQLRKGDTGAAVVELQLRLLQLDAVYDGQAHGRYDKATRDAVAAFQHTHRVHGDPRGVYGEQTRAALEQLTTEP